jgi:secreted trypsin-like serine protease
MHKQLLISLVSIAITCLSCTKKDEVIETKAKVLCSDGEVKFDGAGLTGIVGGGLLKKDSSLAKGIVYIQTKDFEGYAYMCTGSLIAKDLVLTAAHCIEGVKKNSDLTVAFTHQPECDASKNIKSEVIAVEAFRIHSAWKNPEFPNERGDLAMIKLKSQAPAPWKPLKLATEFIPMENSKIVVAGFGADSLSGKESSSVSLRIAVVAPTQETEKEYFGKVATSAELKKEKISLLMENSEKDELLYISQSDGVGVCSGDSGGPSLMQDPSSGRFVQTGVASVVLRIEEDRLCGFAGGHTSIHFHRQWIEETAKALRSRL